ncbi:Crp/Fnr family transcriptional regulator [Sulfurospirillum sp. 1612]|uniref:Crp/Fnr family transcriptional regulator n=1 Tax=Sulfurospirillum sp. 1612 TaxID=3094835 RepID=UPI002F949043
MIEKLAATPLLKSLPKEIIEEIASFSKLKSFAKGEILFYENDAVDTIYYLLSGSLKFYKVDRFDNEIFLYKLPKNSLIFDLSKLCDEFIIHCYANAEFLEESEVLAIDSQPFKHLMSTNQNFLQCILKEAFLMIQQLQCVISRDVVFDGAAKVAHMICEDLENFNKLKKHEIAYMLHIQPETLSRILKKFVRTNVIMIEQNNVIIVDKEKLKSIFS